IESEGASMQVMGVPACALFFKHTVFDLLLPRLLAGRRITRAELARLGEGGYCQSCRACTFPKCGFGK
ncbi:MAG: trehalose-binding protein, partial [Mailhella sp.]|nr:trehalose-binding protein [Mailhella sp.]